MRASALSLMETKAYARWTTWIFLMALGLVSPRWAWGETISAKLLREDFQIMRLALEEGHGGVYRNTSKADLDRTFSRAYRRIDQPMSALEFWRLVAPVVAQIKCGHTSIWWPEEIQTKILSEIPLLPLSVRVFDGRLYVYRDFSMDNREFEGAEIVSINGVPAKRILKAMMTVVTGDGNSKTAKAYRIGHYGYFNMFLYALMGIEGPFRVVCRDEHGKKIAVEMEGILSRRLGELSAARNPEASTNADLKFLDEGKIAVLTIRHWYRHVDSEAKLTLADFLQKSFEEIHQKRSSDLIIDLRDNDGGLDEPGKQVFSYLWPQPFRYYRDLVINAREFGFFQYAREPKPIPSELVELQSDRKFHFVKHENWGLQQPREPHFNGRVFALMNGGSFSTTCEFLSMLHFHKRGTLIGEEAAGGYDGNTSGFNADVVLPHSKLLLPLRLTTYYLAVSGRKRADRSVLPDYPVRHTIADLLAGNDKDMGLALSLARGREGGRGKR
jgi:hypothetical protein